MAERDRLFDLRMKQMNYLYDAMPKQPGGVYLVNNSWKPSPQSLQKFERIYRTVTEPMTIFTDVSRGTATREQVKALQTLYPRLHGDLVASVMEALEKTPNVPHAVQIKLGSLLGAPVSFSQTPAFAMALQKIAGEGQQQQSDGAPSGSPGGSLRPTKINSSSKMSESMRVANR